MRLGLLSLCLLPLLAACEDRAEPVTPAPVPARGRAAEPTPPAPLDEAPSFVGVWAARPELCRNGSWMFTPQGVRTAGEVSCAWSKVEKTETGYALAGTCTAEGVAKPAEAVLTIDPAKPAAMTVTGGPWAGPIALTRCSAEPLAAAPHGRRPRRRRPPPRRRPRTRDARSGPEHRTRPSRPARPPAATRPWRW